MLQNEISSLSLDSMNSMQLTTVMEITFMAGINSVIDSETYLTNCKTSVKERKTKEERKGKKKTD